MKKEEKPIAITPKQYKLRIKTFTLKVRERIEGERITTASQSYSIIKNIIDKCDAGQEHFVVLYLDNKMRVQYFKVLLSGGTDEITIDTKVIFRTALLVDASNLILAHNHPSGDITPSKADNNITIKLKEAGKLIGIPIRDHLIVTEQNNDFYSYCEENLL